MIFNLGIVIITFLVMEAVAWITHKYVMHGLLWNWHIDHHQPNLKTNWFERNDLFFLIFAIPGSLFCITGVVFDLLLFQIGLGITLYGIAYFFVHDIFIHQRFKILRNAKNPYLLAIRKAHKVHHKHLGRGEGECFGMLFVPYKYFKYYLNR